MSVKVLARETEFFLGHRGRVEALLAQLQPATARSLSLREVARASRRKSRTYEQHHTNRPFFRLFGRIAFDEVCDEPSAARFCSQCAAADLQRGYSWWRREHQISGYLICAVHGVPLKTARAHPYNVFADQPHYHEVESIPAHFPVGRSLALILGYQAAVLALLTTAEQFRREAVHLALRCKYSSEAVRARFDKKLGATDWGWLETWGPGTPSVDGITRGIVAPITPEQCALAIALLYDDAQRAISDFRLASALMFYVGESRSKATLLRLGIEGLSSTAPCALRSLVDRAKAVGFLQAHWSESALCAPA